MKKVLKKERISINNKIDINLSGESLKEALNYYFGNIMVVDGNGILLYINESGARLYGFTSEKMVGTSIYDLVENGLQDKSVCAEAIEKRERVFSQLRTKLGVEVACVANPILDKNGNVDRVVVYSQDESLIRDIMKDIETEKLKSKKIKQTMTYLQENDERNQEIVTSNSKMKELYRIVKSIARTDSTIMIYGESGTGKEVLARFVHKNSKRNNEVFIPINCAAIPSELMESEFFGYEKGSFTGANKDGKAGLFEMANKGTFFLDELGELPLSLQSKLLRVLESGEVKRIGSSKTIYTDVRIIAATNRDLKKMVAEKTFREDLYYRLNVIPIRIPPLRERPEDIEALANNFLKEYNRKYSCNKYASKELMEKFKSYSWPGNIRELRNEIERLVITSKADFLSVDSDIYQFDITSSKYLENESLVLEDKKDEICYKGPLKTVVGEFEEKYVKGVIEECGGKMTEAARKLGIHRSALYKKMDKYIEKDCKIK